MVLRRFGYPLPILLVITVLRPISNSFFMFVSFMVFPLFLGFIIMVRPKGSASKKMKRGGGVDFKVPCS